MIHDENILQAMSINPENGFRMLLAQYKEPIYWHIRRMVVNHDDAQDATQETFVRAFRHYRQCQSSDKLRGWLFTIATREALRLLDKRKTDTLSLDKGIAQFADEYFDHADQVAVLLQKAILSLPRKQQLAFNLRYYDDLSYAEIASVADCSEAAAKANYHIAKEKIVKYIQSNDL